MKENVIKYNFTIIKFIMILSLDIYIVFRNESISFKEAGLQVMLLFIFTATMIIYELINKNKIYIILVNLIIIFAVISNIGSDSLLLVTLVYLDSVSYFKLSLYFYLVTFLGIAGVTNKNEVYLICCVLINLIYFQENFIVRHHKDILESLIQNEDSLKENIVSEKLKNKSNVEKYRLKSEKDLLEERSKLSQALHDKIGHRINGSIYQLEACKLLIDKKPEDSRNIIEAVIINLRSGLDEIRAILRKEKPNKGELALLQLWKLCEDFNINYGINANIITKGEKKNIPEHIWEIILENSIEAFSNSLKYSKCNNIDIEIIKLNKMVRCIIKDNGTGCINIEEGMGISGMKQRLRKIDGTLDIQGELGFQINMLIPIKERYKCE